MVSKSMYHHCGDVIYSCSFPFARAHFYSLFKNSFIPCMFLSVPSLDSRGRQGSRRASSAADPGAHPRSGL